MRYMNNHFGQSRIFGNARCKMPMNLQTFAESGEGGESGAESGAGGGEGSGGESGAGEGSGGEENTPTVEELVAQLATERARSAKLQNEKDMASSEAATYKKQLRAKMSADEQAEEAKKEAEAAKDARIQELETKFRINDYCKRYMGIGRESNVAMDEKTATELAEFTGEIADADKFFSALDKFVKAAVKKGSEDYVQSLIKNGGSINAGNGDGKKESEAVRLAKESAARRANKGLNEDALKQWM